MDGRVASPEFREPAAAIAGSSNGGVVALSSTGTLASVPSLDITRRSLVWISPDGSQSDARFGQREFGGVSLSPDDNIRQSASATAPKLPSTWRRRTAEP